MASEGNEDGGLDLIGKYQIEREFLARFRVERFGATFGTNQLFGLLDLIEKFLTPESTVCEIGCYDGISTSLFARTCKLVSAIDWNRHKPCRPAMQKVLLQYSNIRFARSKSPEAANLFHDRQFDAVYLDAAHDFKSVTADIQAWTRKVRPGGILAGHDFVSDKIGANEGFNWKSKAMGYGGVRPAVEAAFDDREIHLFDDSSWAVII